MAIPLPITPDARPRWWQWPTILSLDAPAVVLIWQATVAATAGVSLSWPQRFVLGASVWLAYTGDRWLEALRLGRVAARTPRHRFHQRWRWPVAVTGAIVLAADVGVALARVPTGDLVVGVLLTTAVLAYLLSHQWLHRHARWRVPKEVCVAVLLSGGVWLFVRQASGVTLWLPLGLFGLLVLANCTLISRWEMEVDRLQGQTSLALSSPRLVRGIVVFPVFAIVVAILVIAVGPAATHPAAIAALISALLLAGVDALAPRQDWAAARVMFDLALMTPVALLVAG